MPVTQLGTRDIPLADLARFPGNARRGNVPEIRKSLMRHGQYRALIVRQHDGKLTILAGNHTADALTSLVAEPPTLDQLLQGVPARYRQEQEPAARALLDQLERGVARCEVLECTDADAVRVNVADNRMADLGEYDDRLLAEQLASLDGDLDGTGFDMHDLDDLADILDEDEQGDGRSPDEEERPSLADRFLIPPFDVLDARQGWWRERKRAWIALGIKSELGRGTRIPAGGGLTFKGQDSLNRIMDEHR